MHSVNHQKARLGHILGAYLPRPNSKPGLTTTRPCLLFLSPTYSLLQRSRRKGLLCHPTTSPIMHTHTLTGLTPNVSVLPSVHVLFFSLIRVIPVRKRPFSYWYTSPLTESPSNTSRGCSSGSALGSLKSASATMLPPRGALMRTLDARTHARRFPHP